MGGSCVYKAYGTGRDFKIARRSPLNPCLAGIVIVGDKDGWGLIGVVYSGDA
jgi:hypothetical protein